MSGEFIGFIFGVGYAIAFVAAILLLILGFKLIGIAKELLAELKKLLKED